jgi:phage terminase large subunit GpA-like protein
MGKFEFCQRFLFLKGEPISFSGRPYLLAPYNSIARRLVIRASRQVEKTTFVVNTILHAAVRHPQIHILFVCPRQEQARVFSNARLLPAIQDSPLLRRHLLGRSKRKVPVEHLRFANKSEVYIRAAYRSGDTVRGIDADLLLVDEFQDIASGHLPVLEQTLSHSALGKVVLTGTPKTIDNHLESYFGRSTANEFQVPCRACQHDVLLDDGCLGPHGPMCSECCAPIQPQEGRWIARNPTSTWGDGFWINHLMVPWLNYADLLEHHRTYDPAHFKNECLGLPTTLGEHLVTRAELEACCQNRPMFRRAEDVLPAFRNRLVAGIDWGGGARSRTVLVIGYMDDAYRFVVVRFDRFVAREDPDTILTEVVRRCKQFGICRVAADGGGNGQVYNRLLFDRLDQPTAYFGIYYSATDQKPLRDGALWQWTVGRSASIGTLFARIKKKALLFPRVAESGSFLDEIGCELAEYDDANRCIKYIHPETQPDDALHATNYAWLLGTREHRSRHEYD